MRQWWTFYGCRRCLRQGESWCHREFGRFRAVEAVNRVRLADCVPKDRLGFMFGRLIFRRSSQPFEVHMWSLFGLLFMNENFEAGEGSDAE